MHLQAAPTPGQPVPAMATPAPISSPIKNAVPKTAKASKTNHAASAKKAAANQKAALAKHKDAGNATLASGHKA
ncbi:hypothetical protein ACP3W1_27225, partial [Salmonella enterica]|uniref:hypothetical protein n=1 Tax=Salmonella enterica TaxID=28901 RepID=UPI003CF9A7A6